jgi:branched-chain amino acid transport system substrate-binding protein
VPRWHKRFGADYPYITELAVATYQGMHLWALGVKKAGSTDRMKVTQALESGLSYEGPSGKVTMDAATHHCHARHPHRRGQEQADGGARGL